MLQRIKHSLKRIYPFNTEQSVNILSEFGPLVTMFIVNAAVGINAGTWALLITTVMAMVVMRMMLGRLPVFPLIASTVTITFGVLTLLTNDPMWVQIKVTIFNALFAGVLFGGLYAARGQCCRLAGWSVVVLISVGLLAEFAYLLMTQQLHHIADAMMSGELSTMAICLGALIVGFICGAAVLKRNFFEYVFEKTFHYTQEGWDRFTYSFAWFFMFTAVANEAVRLAFEDGITIGNTYMEGVQVWILFKILIIMPLSGLYAWYLTRLMHKHRINPPAPVHDDVKAASTTANFRKDAAEFAAVGMRITHAAVIRSSAAETR